VVIITGFGNNSGNTIVETLSNTERPAIVRYTTPAANSCPGSTFTVDVTTIQTAWQPTKLRSNLQLQTPHKFSYHTRRSNNYTWTNNNPSIGLASSGTGNILPLLQQIQEQVL
jgi:hypothetical protein